MIGYIALFLVSISQAAVLYWILSSGMFACFTNIMKTQFAKDSKRKTLRLRFQELVVARQWTSLNDWMVERPDVLRAESNLGPVEIPLLYQLLLFDAPINLIELLLHHLPDDLILDDIGQSPLHWVTGRLSVNPETTRRLIKLYPTQAVELADRYGKTPLTLIWERFEESSVTGNPAFSESCRDTALYILTSYAAAVAAGNEGNIEPSLLHVACACPVPKGMIQLFAEDDPEALARPGVCGRTPLEIFCQTKPNESSIQTLSKLKFLLITSSPMPDVLESLFLDACQAGWNWNEGLWYLLSLAPQELLKWTRGMPPALLAASAQQEQGGHNVGRLGLPTESLTTIFALLRPNPKQLPPLHMH